MLDESTAATRGAPAPGNSHGNSPASMLRAALREDVPSDAVEAHIGLQVLGPVALVTLSRPEQHNVLSLASWQRLHSIFRRLAERSDLRAVVVRGAGQRAFSAGADITEFPAVRLTVQDALVYNETLAEALRSIADVPVPVIAMVGGLAVGGGCELAASCDVRIATTQARFGLAIGRLGVTLGYTEANVVSRAIGPGALKYLLFSGQVIPAEVAAQFGLVQRVVEPGGLIDEVVGLVESILDSSEVTIRAAKLVVDMCARPLSAADTEVLTRITVDAYGGPDLKEGVAAFQAKRAPQFATSERRADVRA
jgi:enoyl-CoA hydratase